MANVTTAVGVLCRTANILCLGRNWRGETEEAHDDGRRLCNRPRSVDRRPQMAPVVKPFRVPRHERAQLVHDPSLMSCAMDICGGVPEPCSLALAFGEEELHVVEEKLPAL